MESEQIAPSWRIQLFGEPKAFLGDREAELPGVRRVLLLLIRVTSSPNRIWSRDEICELLWPGEYIDISRDRLRQTLALLNKALRDTGGEPPIIATKTTIRANVELLEIDTEQFSALLKKASLSDDACSRKAALIEATHVGKKPFAEGFTDDWVRAIRDRLSNEVHAARLELAQLMQQSGEEVQALDVLDAAIAERPLDEPCNLLKAQILKGAGRMAEAVFHAKEYKNRIQSDLKLQPGQEWSEFLEGESSSTTAGFQQTKISLVGKVIWHHIAQALTRFFGREQELERLSRAFADGSYRLVTITGPGGSGKTRLAVEFVRSQKPDGLAIVGVGLADIEDARRVPFALAEAIGLQISAESDVWAELTHAAAGTRLWLILDNCEHLMPEIAEVVQRLLEAIPNAKILCTSRALLGLLGERELALQPLKTPDKILSRAELMQYPSVSLLVERIQASLPEYCVTEEEAPTLSQLSELLEGIPLAIEIAASRSRVMTTKDMVAGLEKRLDFLTSKYANLPERHRAMRNALEWSFSDLSEDLRRLMLRMSIFVSPWTLEAATFVSETDSADDAVLELRSRSLIQADSSSGEMRFRMLEIVRQFAQEQMSESERTDALTLHMKFWAAAAQANFDRLYAGDRPGSSLIFRQMLPDLRVALETALSNPGTFREELYVLTVKQMEFFEAAGMMEEASVSIKRAIHTQVFESDDLIRASFAYGHTRAILIDIEALRELTPRLLSMVPEAKEPYTRNGLLLNISHMAWIADLPAISEQALPLMEEHIGKVNAEKTGLLILNIGNTLTHLRRIEEACNRYQQAIDMLSDFPPSRALGYAQLNLARRYLDRGHATDSLKLCQVSLTTLVAAQEALGASNALRGLITAYIACDPKVSMLREVGLIAGFERGLRRRHGARPHLTEGSGFQLALQNIAKALCTNEEQTLLAGEAMEMAEVLRLAEQISSSFQA